MARFDDTLVQAITALVQQQQQALRIALGQPPTPEHPDRLGEPSPLQNDLALLIQVANGEYQRAKATRALVQRVELALQQLATLVPAGEK